MKKIIKVRIIFMEINANGLTAPIADTERVLQFPENKAPEISELDYIKREVYGTLNDIEDQLKHRKEANV